MRAHHFKALGLLFLAVSMSLGFEARATRFGFQPKSLGIIGDSASTGFLANYRRDQKVTRAQQDEIRQLFEGPFSEDFLNEVAQEGAPFAWPQKLGKSLKISSRKIINASVMSAGSAGLMDQLEVLIRESRAAGLKRLPEMVVVNIGANDLCDYEGPSFEEQFSRMYRLAKEIRRRSPSTRIFFMPMPHKFLQIGSSPVADAIDAVVPEIFFYNPATYESFALPASPTCGQVHSLGLTCPRVAEYGQLNSNGRRELRRQLSDYNWAMEKVTRKIPGTFYLKSFEKTPSRPEYVSVDCFHPTEALHRRIASELRKALDHLPFTY